MGILDIFKKKRAPKKADTEPRVSVEKEKQPTVKPSHTPKAKTATSAQPKPAKKQKPVIKKIQPKADKSDTRHAYKTLHRHIVTEKTTRTGEKNQYTFEVSPQTNKVQVRKAIQAVYGVTPVKINVLNQVGKNVRFGQYYGKQKLRKKAVVTLKKGDSIKESV